MSRGRILAWAGVAVAAACAVAAGAWFLRPKGGPPPQQPAPSPLSSQRAPQKLEVAEVVFDSGFGKGWEDGGWGPRESSDAGTLRIGFGGYGGIIFQHDELESRFGALVFRFRAPESFGSFLGVSLKNDQSAEKDFPEFKVEPRHLVPLEGGWKEALVPWPALNPGQSPFDRIVIRARELVASDWVEVDKVLLTKAGLLPATDAPVRQAKLSVDCRGTALRVSPLIYGVLAAPADMGATAHRIGGNRLSRNNWDLGTTNTGSDWFFENVDEGDGPFAWLAKSRQGSTKTAIVVPTIGWVAKDGTSVGFPVSKLGKQAATDPHRPEAGNGVRADGSPIPPGPPTQTSVAAPPELIKKWVERLRREDAAAGKRAVDMYLLDNEPDLWHVTHRDVHPEPLSYDELLDRTLRYGTAIRQADPEAVIAGPTSWGWTGYFYSALDQAKKGILPHPDRRAHGGEPLLAWYLKRLAEHEKSTGVRVLDVLDVHYYPQAGGVCQGARTDADGAALRLRSTRSLWDPEYRDESWIGDQVKLLPRLKEWVAANYPGRGIALGEWSFCAEDHISGGLAVAEALGRFAQQGLTAAFFWGKINPDSPTFWAYRAYRNFDGTGGRFLDWSLPTRGTDGVSVFASRDDTGSRLVAVVVNQHADFAADVSLDVSSCGEVKSQRVFSYAPGAKGLGENTGVVAQAPRGLFGGVAPPHSITVIEGRLSRAPP